MPRMDQMFCKQSGESTFGTYRLGTSGPSKGTVCISLGVYRVFARVLLTSGTDIYDV